MTTHLDDAPGKPSDWYPFFTVFFAGRGDRLAGCRIDVIIRRTESSSSSSFGLILEDLVLRESPNTAVSAYLKHCKGEELIEPEILGMVMDKIDKIVPEQQELEEVIQREAKCVEILIGRLRELSKLFDDEIDLL